MHVIKQNQVQEKIISIRNQKVIIDSDVAKLYGVETKRINEAVKNNPKKFPHGYLLELTREEKNQLVEIFDQFKKLKHSSATACHPEACFLRRRISRHIRGDPSSKKRSQDDTVA